MDLNFKRTFVYRHDAHRDWLDPVSQWTDYCEPIT